MEQNINEINAAIDGLNIINDDINNANIANIDANTAITDANTAIIANAANISASAETKKKPGRPKKQPINIPIKLDGITRAPNDPDNYAEIVYYNPPMFKKILVMLKQYAVSEINMIFDPTGLTIKSQDHAKKSDIDIRIEGKYMHWYHCKDTYKVCIKRGSLEKILNNLVKEHYKIAFILKDNYRSVIYMNTKDSTYNNDNTYEIEVSYHMDEQPPARINDDTNYPVKFEFTSKHFKSQIKAINDLSPMFTIQKNGLDPLQITFDKAQSVQWTGIYPDSSAIKLKSTVAADDIFCVDMIIDNIKPFSNSNIGDFVQIAASMTEKMSFTTCLDRVESPDNSPEYACKIKIYTEIKDFRRA